MRASWPARRSLARQTGGYYGPAYGYAPGYAYAPGYDGYAYAGPTVTYEAPAYYYAPRYYGSGCSNFGDSHEVQLRNGLLITGRSDRN